MGTCIQQGDLFYSVGIHRNYVLATANTGKLGRGFGKNAGEWTGSVEISKEEESLAVWGWNRVKVIKSGTSRYTPSKVITMYNLRDLA